MVVVVEREEEEEEEVFANAVNEGEEEGLNDEEALWHVADCSSSASTLSSSPLHVSCLHFVAVCSTQNLACLSVGVPASHGGGRLVITLGSARGGSGSPLEESLPSSFEESSQLVYLMRSSVIVPPQPDVRISYLVPEPCLRVSSTT